MMHGRAGTGRCGDFGARPGHPGLTTTVLLPVREFDLGKSRLAGALGPDQRRALNRRFFEHVLGISIAVVGAARCLVVSRSSEVGALAQAAGAGTLAEHGHDLNAALAQGRDAVWHGGGGGALLTLSTDLPHLHADDLRALIAAGQHADVVIATDRHGTGTNALWLARPAAFHFHYGQASRAAHEAEAAGSGWSHTVLVRRGLSHDIDLPAELEPSF